MKVQEAEAESLKAEATISNLEAEAKAEVESRAEAAISHVEAEAQAEVESLKAWKPKLKVLLAELQLAEPQLVEAFAGNWMSMLQLAEAKAGGGDPKNKARSWPEVPNFA